MSYKLWLGVFGLALTRHPSTPGRKKGQSPNKTVAGNRHEKRRITIRITTRREQREYKKRIEEEERE
jgi:hypothetical protein